MARTPIDFDTVDAEHFGKAFEVEIVREIRRNLQERVMAVIQPQIDEVIERAVQELKVRVVSNRDIMMDRLVVHLVVNKAA